MKTKTKNLAGVNRQQGIELALLVATNDLPGLAQALESIEDYLIHAAHDAMNAMHPAPPPALSTSDTHDKHDKDLIE